MVEELTGRVVADGAQTLEDREVFTRIRASMTQTAHVHASTSSAFTVDKVR
jgi:hypothetical protein